MNIQELQKLGHEFILDALTGLSSANGDELVCGTWTLKDVIGHLATFELLRLEFVQSYWDNALNLSTPILAMMQELGSSKFNDTQANRRKSEAYDDIIKEYVDSCNKVMELIMQVPVKMLKQKGMFTWYYPQLDGEDFLIHSGFAHKLEHGGQINILKTRLTGNYV